MGWKAGRKTGLGLIESLFHAESFLLALLLVIGGQLGKRKWKGKKEEDANLHLFSPLVRSFSLVAIYARQQKIYCSGSAGAPAICRLRTFGHLRNVLRTSYLPFAPPPPSRSKVKSAPELAVARVMGFFSSLEVFIVSPAAGEEANRSPPSP